MAALSADAGLARFIHAGKDGVPRFEAAIKGARCASCIAKIENGVRALPGVTDARLNLSTGKLLTSWRGLPDPQAVLQRVRDLGYEAQPFDAPQAMNAAEREGRFLLRCLAVAGFGTIFVMGLTDSIWYGGDMTPALRQTFFWLAGMVSVPVTLYAGQPFFASAWRALKAGTANMDVPIAAALLLSLGLSFWQAGTHQHHTYFDAAVMLAFLLLVGRYLDFHLRDKAQGAARHLLALQSQLTRRLRADGTVETVAAQDVQVGDRVLLAPGERLIVDAKLLSPRADIDMSLVTGESLPVAVQTGAALRAGSINAGAACQAEATARMADSLVADLARLLEVGRQRRNAYVRAADKAARLYVPLVSGMAVMVLAGWLLAGADVAVAVTNAIAVLIITCPCALGLAVPAVQIAATGRLFAQGLLVKSGDALERLADIDTVIFDKTGTLTRGVLRLENRDGIAPEILEQAARLARASSHPLSRALSAAAGDGPVADGVREQSGAGLEAAIDGVTYRLGSASWCGAQVTGDGGELWYRAGPDAPVRFVFRDSLRSDAAKTVVGLRMRGITVEMLTGDGGAVAAQTAGEADIRVWHSGVGPQQKAARLESLRADGRRVLMVGDGLNDAAAMALAHVSIAPGTAADISQMTADMVLQGEKLALVVEAIDVARKARRLVRQNFLLAALYNVLAIPLAAAGLVTPLIAAGAMASSSILVSLNALRLVGGRAR